MKWAVAVCVVYWTSVFLCFLTLYVKKNVMICYISDCEDCENQVICLLSLWDLLPRLFDIVNECDIHRSNLWFLIFLPKKKKTPLISDHWYLCMWFHVFWDTLMLLFLLNDILSSVNDKQINWVSSRGWSWSCIMWYSKPGFLFLHQAWGK